MPFRPIVPLAAAALIAMLALAGCGTPRREAASPPAAPTVESLHRQETLDDCPEQLAPCATIKLDYVEVHDAPAPLVAAVRAFQDTTVFAPIDEGGEPGVVVSADSLMRQFLDSYRDFMQSFPEAPGSWSIVRSVRPIWNDRGVLSLAFTEESYTGGAHPNAGTKLLSLDATSGRRLRLSDLFQEGYEAPLQALGEKAFRAAHGLGPADDLDAAGFWFEGGRFRLSENLAVTEAGLEVHYDAYEVAPYAMGPTDLTLSRASLARWAKPGGPLAAASE